MNPDDWKSLRRHSRALFERSAHVYESNRDQFANVLDLETRPPPVGEREPIGEYYFSAHWAYTELDHLLNAATLHEKTSTSDDIEYLLDRLSTVWPPTPSYFDWMELHTTSHPAVCEALTLLNYLRYCLLLSFSTPPRAD